MKNRKLKFIALVGSIRKHSYNKSLLKALQQLAKDKIDIEHFDIASIPFLNTDLENEPSYTSSVLVLRNRIKAADGVIFVTPEYNNMLSGVLKNTIEWLSRDKPEISVIKEKWAVIMGASDGRFGTVRAQNQLLELCAILQMKVHGRLRFPLAQAETVFDDKGNLVDVETRQRLTTFVSTITEIVK